MTTPTGNGEGGLRASFRDIAGLNVTGLTDAMSTPRNLENILQQKEEISFTKEVEDFEAARTAGGGAWEDLIFGVYGYNRGGVEWMVTGGDVSLICSEKNSCGSCLCTDNADVCTVKTYLASKAELKPLKHPIRGHGARQRACNGGCRVTFLVEELKSWA
jgi:hypothetical protein